MPNPQTKRKRNEKSGETTIITSPPPIKKKKTPRNMKEIKSEKHEKE